MAIHLVEQEAKLPKYLFLDIYGGGWVYDLINIVKDHIQPQTLDQKLHSASWHSSASEISFSKENIDYQIYLDGDDSIEFRVLSEDYDTSIFQEFAEIIDQESQALK